QRRGVDPLGDLDFGWRYGLLGRFGRRHLWRLGDREHGGSRGEAETERAKNRRGWPSRRALSAVTIGHCLPEMRNLPKARGAAIRNKKSSRAGIGADGRRSRNSRSLRHWIVRSTRRRGRGGFGGLPSSVWCPVVWSQPIAWTRPPDTRPPGTRHTPTRNTEEG